jgi:hypothetical protein
MLFKLQRYNNNKTKGVDSQMKRENHNSSGIIGLYAPSCVVECSFLDASLITTRQRQKGTAVS